MASQLHTVLVPLMSPGHFIPMMDMAKLLAQHQVTVTIITTPLVASRIEATIDCANKTCLSLRLILLPFPSVEAGLPEGCETTDTIPTQNLIKNFLAAIDLLQQPFERVLEQLAPLPTCIIADKNIIFLSETARKYRIQRIIFDGMSCFTLLCSHSLRISKVHERAKENEPFVVPGLPDRIELTKAQLPGEFNPEAPDVHNFRKRVREAEEKADGVVINSFKELEKEYVNEYKKVRGGKVWCMGPFSLCNESDFEKAQRGDKSSIDSSNCLKWLDSQQPSSVVYACLGSLSRLTKPQLVELGLGLEASKHPFIWVIRGGDQVKEMKEWLEEEGFKERIRERGLVICGWAPQVLILSHKAVGAFLTHCGWNSTLEGVCAGVPMVTWPMFAEQFFNEKLIVQVLEVGVSIGARVVVHFGDEDKFGVLVKREMVTGAVDKVMDEEKEGRERQKRARALREMATRAVKQGGSSQVNMTLLIEGIMRQASQMQLE